MNFKLINRFLIAFLLTVFFAGCDLSNNGDDEDPQPTDEYLLTYEEHVSYSSLIIKALIENFLPAYPELGDILNDIEHGVTVYKITYTTTFNDEEIIASGLVSVPFTQGIEFPILSFQNGTNSLHREAPSVKPDSEFYLLLEFLASTGFVVSIPDYLGFGASDQMFHPYLDKESTVQTVIDMTRAVKELINNHLDTEISDDLYINGYSQGGWATMQLQKEIEEKYSSEFNLVASACGAGPYDLNYINSYILQQTTYPEPYFVGYIYNSYIQLGSITNPASDVFNSPYNERIMSLYDGTLSGDEINAQLTTSVAGLFTADYIQNYTNEKYSSVTTSLISNSIEAWKTVTPTMIIHGTDDSFVPTKVSENIYLDFRAKGVTSDQITYVSIPDADHESAIIPAESAALKWFIELKNGE